MADDTNISEQQNSSKNSNTYKNLKRRKKRKMMRLKLGIAFFALIAIVVILLLVILNVAGVFYKKADTNTFVLNTDGSVVFEEIENNEYLSSQDELSSYIKDLVSDFNSENGKNAVKIQAISVKDNTAYVRLKYKDFETYSDFTGHDIYNGTVKDAMAKGYTFDTSFCEVKDGAFSEAIEADTVTSSEDSKVLIVPEAVNVRINGKSIKYVSSDGTSYVSDDEVSYENAEGTNPMVYVIY